jgi:hypothetical protein
MALNGPLIGTVGIRQVRADGVKLDEAMVLDVVGAPITNETTDDNLNSYKLDLTGLATTAALDTLTSTVSALTSSVTVLSNALTALTTRVTALEAKQFTATSLKVANYTAAAWEHVLVSLSAAGSMTVTLPASSAPTAGARIRVSNVSPFTSESLSIACTFYAPAGGYYASSPYIVANDGGVSLAGASIELLDTGEGWIIVWESCTTSSLV